LNGVIINTNYTPNPKYEWTPDSSVTNPDAQTTWTRPSTTTTYVLKLEDQTHGCIAFDTITIGVVPPGLYGLPNAFTPNGDGQNDFFYPFFPPGSSAYVSELRIYNRWGQLVYSGPLSPGWDGNVGGQPAPMDTYTYYIQVTVPDASQPSGFTINNVSGNFALLR
jgi:gliding motility-associated-like protein